MIITIPLKPKPIQSVRFGKNIYQKKDVKLFKARIKYCFHNQYPNFQVIENKQIKIKIEHQYDFKNLLKWQKKYALENGGFPKITRPDVTDNLNKGVIDALTSEVWKDDSLIVSCLSKKFYANGDFIRIYVNVLEMPKKGMQKMSKFEKGEKILVYNDDVNEKVEREFVLKIDGLFFCKSLLKNFCLIGWKNAKKITKYAPSKK